MGKAAGKGLSSTKNGKRMLERTVEELMKTYGEKNAVVGRSAGNLAKSVSTL